MSGADYFTNDFAINAHMDSQVAVDVNAAKAEHDTIRQAFEAAGINVIKVKAPANCQDGVYTANWGLCRGNKVVLASLPNKRQAEEPYARRQLKLLGRQVIPAPFPFSGQGDALPCGNLIFCGSQYRTDPRMHRFLAEQLGYNVISLQTVPVLDQTGKPKLNDITGWPDSFFYDLDLALSVIRTDLIAWCPEAFLPESQAKIRALDAVEKIEVSLDEAKHGLACNLVSTGETVVMSANAPMFQAELEARRLKTVPINAPELTKGGGFIRCISLTLDNQ